jgi:hypothetical protein
MKRLALLLVVLGIAGMACGSATPQATEGQTTVADTVTGTVTDTPAGPMPRARTAQVGAQPKPGDTRTPPSVPIPTARPSIPEPTATSAEPPIVEIVDLSLVGEGDAFEMIGLARNVGVRDLAHVYVTLTFHSPSGEVLDTRRGGIETSTLPVGEVAPFVMYFPLGVPADTENVTTSAEWYFADADYPVTREGFEILGPEGHMGDGNYEITGSVLNAGDEPAHGIMVVGMAFNAQGRFIGYSMDLVEDLAAGARAPFTMAISPHRLAEPDVATIEVIAEGRRGTE